MNPSHPIARVWRALSGSHLTVVCLGFLLAYLAAGQAAAMWSAAFSITDPQTGEWIERLGLIEGARSRGFIFGLSVLGLNLASGCVAPFLSVTRVPVQERFNFACDLSVRISFLIAIISGGWAVTHFFSARMVVEEGSRVRVAEVISGAVPATWQVVPTSHTLHEVPAGGPYFDPGFALERSVPATPQENDSESFLYFFEKDQLKGSLTVRRGWGTRYRGWVFHGLRSVPSTAQSVDLEMTGTDAQRRFPALARGQGVDLEDVHFKITEVQPETELNGPAVQIAYQETGRETETFWVFGEFPDYDFAHRKSSRQHFTLRSLRGRKAAELSVSRAPGAIVAWVALLLAALGSWLPLLGRSRGDAI